MGGKREYTCSVEGTVFSNAFRNFFLHGALRDFGLSRGSPQILVKAFLKKKKTTKQNGGGKPRSHKKHLFCSFFFSKGKGKTMFFDKEKGKSFSHPSEYEYIPCEQMADFPEVALWGNENAELLFFMLLVWGFVRGDFCWTEWDTRKFGNWLFKVHPTAESADFKMVFFLFGCTCKYQAGLFRVKDWTGLPRLE